jgi:hypothetical protein
MDLADNDLLDVLLNRPLKALSEADPEAQVLQQVLALGEVQTLLPLLRT